MLERQRWVVHQQVSETIDSLLRGREPILQERNVSETGEVSISQKGGVEAKGNIPVQPFGVDGWRSSG